MRTLSVLICLALFCACPPTPGVDGGTGGGGGFGGGFGGGAGGTGGGGGGTGGGTSGALTFSEFCSTLQTNLCDYGARCGLFDSRAGCEQLYDRSLGLNCDTYGPSVRDGRVAFDGAGAAQCFNSLGDGCSMPASCGNFFSGTVPLDGECYLTDDCVSTAYCDSSQLVCPGRCLARASEGAFVQNGRGCQADLVATFGRSDAGSFGYICTRKSALGQPCMGYESCTDDLVCNAESGVCETRRGENAVCNFADGGLPGFTLCQTNLFCQPETTGSRWVCGAPRAIGERCGACRFDLRCAPGDGGVGSCAALSGLGGDCARSTECERGFFCKATGSSPFGAGTCQPPGARGSECNGTSDSCQAGNRCEQVSNPDGGLFPISLCVESDGGVDTSSCVDPTP